MDPSHGLKHLFKSFKMFAKKKIVFYLLNKYLISYMAANSPGPDDLMKSKLRIRIGKNSDLNAFEWAMMLLADGLV